MQASSESMRVEGIGELTGKSGEEISLTVAYKYFNCLSITQVLNVIK